MKVRFKRKQHIKVLILIFNKCDKRMNLKEIFFEIIGKEFTNPNKRPPKCPDQSIYFTVKVIRIFIPRT
jgi:hypothetical protein